MKRLAIVGIPGRWSSEHLVQVIEERTGFAHLIEMARLRLDLEGGTLWDDTEDLSLFDGILVKKVSSSYSPDILNRLELLCFLEQRGVPFFSRPSRILQLINRLSCTTRLRLAQIPMPATVLTEDVEAAAAAVERFGRAVLKPLYSTKARGMRVLEPGPTLLEEVRQFQRQENKMIYVQQWVSHPGRDLGVVFLGGSYVATYAREGNEESWNTTIRAGGCYAPFEPSREIIELAWEAQRPFDLDFTCVDVVETPEGPLVYEVSAFGGFRGLHEAHNLDAAALYTDYVLDRLKEAPRQAAKQLLFPHENHHGA